MSALTSLLALCAWTLWGYIVLTVDPGVPQAPMAFYAALFVALTCTLGRGFAGPAPDQEGEGPSASVPSLGHAAIVSVLVLFALWLQSLRMLTVFNGILLAAMFAFIELGFFLSSGSRGRARPRRRPIRRPAPEVGMPGAT